MRQVEAQSRGNQAHPPTFAELVYAHHDWLRARQAGKPDAAAEAVYDSVLSAFEAQHGQIIRVYWCSEIESAVALTEKRRRLRSPIFGFHRESDWATQTAPEVAAELHRCDELAVRADAVLTGVRQRICLELVVSCAAHLLSLVDVRAGTGDEAKTAAAVESERSEMKKVKDYYCEAANGQAQLVYFGGIATVMVALAAICTLWLSLKQIWITPIAALLAGAIGAVVSVVQRINNGSFELDYDVGGPYIFFLGGLRPLIGGAFAVAISFAFDGGLLHAPVAKGEDADHARLAVLVISFLAGFSERFAQDTLTAALPEAKSAPAPTPAASPSSGAAPSPSPDPSPERSTS